MTYVGKISYFRELLTHCYILISLLVGYLYSKKQLSIEQIKNVLLTTQFNRENTRILSIL